MSPLDGLWHMLNLVAPALVTGCLAALMAKTTWRRELRSITLGRLSMVTVACTSLGFAVSVALLGRDGMIASYAIMVLTGALSLWWHLIRARSG